MSIEITESAIQSASTATSFARGYELYREGAIFDTFIQGQVLTGKCQGSSAPYYKLHVKIDNGGFKEALCSCPYDWGGYCKHLVALMLIYVYDPDEFVELENVTTLLSSMEKEDLVKLVVKMIGDDPNMNLHLQNDLQAIEEKNGEGNSRKKRKTTVKKADYRRKVRYILHSLDGYRPSEAYWMVPGMVAQLAEVRDSAALFLNDGGAEGALVILTALLTEVGNAFGNIDDSNGDMGYFLDELVLPMVETILSNNLSKTQRDQLLKEIIPVIADLEDYGVDYLGAILEAAEYGWSDDPMRVMGENYYPGVLNEARLNVLERQERNDEYLNLCLIIGDYLRYSLKQIDLGRVETGFDMARKTLTRVDDALVVAITLSNVGKLDEAVEIAWIGMELDGNKRTLGVWLGEVEEVKGRKEHAIRAYHEAFINLPSFGLYQTLKKLSGDDWEALRQGLMDKLDEDAHSRTLAEIFLDEKQWDASIALVDRVGDQSYQLVEDVATKVEKHRPEWVIEVSKRQALELISRTQSKYYAIAVNWLVRVRNAFFRLGREAEWQEYLDELRRTNSRRRALLAELERL